MFDYTNLFYAIIGFILITIGFGTLVGWFMGEVEPKLSKFFLLLYSNLKISLFYLKYHYFI